MKLHANRDLTKVERCDIVFIMPRFIPRRAYGENLTRTTIFVDKDDWLKFRRLMSEQDLTGSEAIRQLMADTIRKGRARQ